MYILNTTRYLFIYMHIQVYSNTLNFIPYKFDNLKVLLVNEQTGNTSVYIYIEVSPT